MTFDVNQITSTLRGMPDRLLQQYAMMNKGNPYVLSLAVAESNQRKQLRSAAQARMAGQQMPKVADAAIAGIAEEAPQVDAMGNVTGMAAGGLPEDYGIARLPTPNMQSMADGGIAGYDDEGMAQGGSMFDFAQRSEPVLRMAEGGMPGYAKGDAIKVYEDRIRAVAEQMGVNPDLAVRMFTKESGGDKSAVSKKGAAGLGQLMIPAAKEMGLKPSERFDPEKNIVASVGYLKKQLDKYGGDAEKALAAYNWGPGNLDKHLAKNEGRLNKIGLPKETADYLTKILPMGAAKAEEVPSGPPTISAAKPAAQTQAAPAQSDILTDKERAALEKPAFVTPSSGKGRKEGKLSEVIKSGEAPRQMALGVSDLPYNIAGAPVDIATAMMRPFGYKEKEPALGSEHLKRLGTKYLGREAESTDPTLRGFRTAGEFAGMAIDPFATTRKVAQSAEGLEALAAAQRAKANAAADRTAVPVGMRLEPPRTEPPVMTVDAQGRAMPADTRARVQQALADEAAVGDEAAKAAALEKQAAAYPGAAQRAEMLKTAEMADRARGTAAAAQAGNVANTGLGALASRTSGINTSGDDLSKFYDMGEAPAKKDIVEAAKEVTPAKERKGFGDDDLLMLGLSLMANKSPNFMTALGEAGIQTLGAKREREKSETEKLYRDALIKQAERPAAEVQLIERYQKDPQFREAYDMFAQSKREPQTRESLLKSWAASPFLQTTYQNPEDYIKMMSAAAGGGASGSQLSSSDQSLIQKYLLR